MKSLAPTESSGRIEINPNVMMGKPVIRGTRITVELILRKLSEGTTEAEWRNIFGSPLLVQNKLLL